MIGIFRDHVAPPEFAKNTGMAQDFVYKTGLNFLVIYCVKNPCLISRF